MQHEQKSNEKRKKKGFVAFKVCQNSTVLYEGVISLNRFMVLHIYSDVFKQREIFSTKQVSTC